MGKLVTDEKDLAACLRRLDASDRLIRAISNLMLATNDFDFNAFERACVSPRRAEAERLIRELYEPFENWDREVEEG